MPAFELLARLTHLTLTVDNSAEYWEDRLDWVGTNQQWLEVRRMEEALTQ